MSGTLSKFNEFPTLINEELQINFLALLMKLVSKRFQSEIDMNRHHHDINLEVENERRKTRTNKQKKKTFSRFILYVSTLDNNAILGSNEIHI